MTIPGSLLQPNCWAGAATLALLLAVPLPGQEAGGQQPDPHQLLSRARSACLALETARYRGRYEEFGERHASGVTAAEVLLSRGDGIVDHEIRFRVSGERRFRESITPLILDAGFDGAALRQLDAAARKVEERRFEELAPGSLAWPLAAGHLGAGGNGVVLWSLVSPRPMRRWLERQDLEYEGRAAIHGVLCDVILVPGGEKHESTRVFLGVEDHLPRKIERIEVMLTDRISGSILTLSDLVVDGAVPDDAFRLTVPPDHELVRPPSEAADDRLVTLGSRAPGFTLRDPAGSARSLADLRGRVVVLDFWGTWCGPCVRKLPDLQRLQEGTRDLPVTILAISCHEPPNGRPAEVMARWGCDVPLLLEGDAVAAAYGVDVFPSVVVVGPEGEVAFRARGGVTLEELQAAVRAALPEGTR